MFVDKPKSILALKSLQRQLKLVVGWNIRFYGRVAIDFESKTITQI